MSGLDTGSPAYPWEPGYVPNWRSAKDMSLRDYFAAKAMQGWVASAPVIMGEPMNGSVEMAEQLAGASFILADAMLKARAS